MLFLQRCSSLHFDKDPNIYACKLCNKFPSNIRFVTETNPLKACGSVWEIWFPVNHRSVHWLRWTKTFACRVVILLLWSHKRDTLFNSCERTRFKLVNLFCEKYNSSRWMNVEKICGGRYSILFSLSMRYLSDTRPMKACEGFMLGPCITCKLGCLD